MTLQSHSSQFAWHSSFRLGVNDERGRTAALGKMRLDERGKSAALKIKTLRPYSEVPRWELEIMQDAAKVPLASDPEVC